MLTSPHDFTAAYQRTVLDKDLESHLRLYDENIHAFDMWGDWKIEGSGAWRAMVTDWFQSLGSERVKCDFTEVVIKERGSSAVLTAFVRYTALDASGVSLRSLCNRITLAMEQSEHGWRVFHQHTSAPIDHAHLRAILEMNS